MTDTKPPVAEQGKNTGRGNSNSRKPRKQPIPVNDVTTIKADGLLACTFDYQSQKTLTFEDNVETLANYVGSEYKLGGALRQVILR